MHKNKDSTKLQKDLILNTTSNDQITHLKHKSTMLLQNDTNDQLNNQNPIIEDHLYQMNLIELDQEPVCFCQNSCICNENHKSVDEILQLIDQ